MLHLRDPRSVVASLLDCCLEAVPGREALAAVIWISAKTLVCPSSTRADPMALEITDVSKHNRRSSCVEERPSERIGLVTFDEASSRCGTGSGT